MDSQKICPECGRHVPDDAPQRLCPDCLMKAVLGTGVVLGPDTATGAERPTAAFVPPSPEEIGQSFPELEILSLLGRGGMGAVYKARQKRLGRIVALKILPPRLQADASFADQFVREAQALAKLHHPHIVTLFEFGETGGLYYFLMELVDGLSLRELIIHRRLSPSEALAIVPQICDALQYAHDRGIVHRDIKPDNILLNQQGEVKIADFGVARLIAAAADNVPREVRISETDTEAGRIIGTPHYMAPEQAANPGEVDHRADIYALGVVFYQMLTGEMPGTSLEPPSRKVQIDVRIDEIVMRALQVEPQLRYQQASEIRTQVDSLAGHSPAPGKTELQPAAKSEPVELTSLKFTAFLMLLMLALGHLLIRKPEDLILWYLGFGIALIAALLHLRRLNARAHVKMLKGIPAVVDDSTAGGFDRGLFYVCLFVGAGCALATRGLVPLIFQGRTSELGWVMAGAAFIILGLYVRTGMKSSFRGLLKLLPYAALVLIAGYGLYAEYNHFSATYSYESYERHFLRTLKGRMDEARWQKLVHSGAVRKSFEDNRYAYNFLRAIIWTPFLLGSLLVVLWRRPGSSRQLIWARRIVGGVTAVYLLLFACWIGVVLLKRS